MRNNFAVFILTHGRPHKQLTIKTLEKCGYTGKYYLIIDTEDKQADEYKKLYGDKVLQFDKRDISRLFDTADTFDDRRAIVYARNVEKQRAYKNEWRLKKVTEAKEKGIINAWGYVSCGQKPRYKRGTNE